MDYTIKMLSEMAGISTRTLRYYDEIGLLKPARTNASGYRIYGEAQIDRLQLILFYRALDFKLDAIKSVMLEADFDRFEALKMQHQTLLAKRRQLDQIILNVERTIESVEGKKMKDVEKFEGLKQAKLSENEHLYGEEIRRLYGDESVESANRQFMNMRPDVYEQAEALAAEIMEVLKEAMESGDPCCERAQEAAKLHKEWLCHYWKYYTAEAHRGLVDMYLADDRFKSYYDQHQPGMAQFLRDAVHCYLKDS